jgi:hypothetical protein
MNTTYNPKTNLWNQLLFLIFALPLGMVALSIVSTIIIASLVMILTPIGMMLAPTWSVQLFQWKFESAIDAWHLPIFGILLDFCLFHLVKWIIRNATQFVNQFLS